MIKLPKTVREATLPRGVRDITPMRNNKDERVEKYIKMHHSKTYEKAKFLDNINVKSSMKIDEPLLKRSQYSVEAKKSD